MCDAVALDMSMCVAQAKSDIIMDEELISQLESTKTLSNDLMEKSKEIEVASKAIQDFCEQ